MKQISKIRVVKLKIKRVIVASFCLDCGQWKNFDRFSKSKPKGIITAKDIGNVTDIRSYLGNGMSRQSLDTVLIIKCHTGKQKIHEKISVIMVILK